MLRRSVLPGTVFITGGCVLILEIVATRLLAPYFGNTIYSVSSVLSVVLAALSAGYYVGGKAADKYPYRGVFFSLIALSGLAVLILQPLQAMVLPGVGYALPLTSGPLIVAAGLFFLPSFILGMLSPFAVVLEQRQTAGHGVGSAAGAIFFFSTAGSIAGSLVTGFVLIPSFGLTSIVIGTGVTLLLLGLPPLWRIGASRSFMGLLLATAVFLTALSGLVGGSSSPGKTLYLHDGVYERIMVWEGVYQGHPTRFLTQDNNQSAAMYLDSPEMAYDYTKYYSLYDVFTPNVQSALVLGGGAYSIPKALLQDLPDARVEVAEIEPRLVDLAKQYFNLPDDPRLVHSIGDGRRALHDTTTRYNLIYSDVYHAALSVPSHLATKEFFELAASKLQPNGVFIANIIGRPGYDWPSFLWSEVKTMQQVFPQLYLFTVKDRGDSSLQNIIAVGHKSSIRIPMDDPRWAQSSYPIVNGAPAKALAIDTKALSPYPVLTDDYAPVEQFMAGVLSR